MTPEPISRPQVIRQLRAYGASEDLIASALGISRQRVAQLAGSRGKPVAPPEAASKPNIPEGDAAILVASRLKAFRVKHKLTQKQLAEILGVHVVTLSFWENGLTCSLPTAILLVLHYLDQDYTATAKLRKETTP